MKLTLSRLYSSAPVVRERLTIASAAIGKYEAKRYCDTWCSDDIDGTRGPPGEIELRTKALLPSVRVAASKNRGNFVRNTLALILCGSALAACSNIPGLGGDQAKVSLESTPTGASASMSSGGTCKTPCTLQPPDKAGDYSVTFGLTGYNSVTVPFKVTMKKENWYSSESPTIEPNPVTATLQQTPAARRR
jgi:hypothetical protein